MNIFVWCSILSKLCCKLTLFTDYSCSFCIAINSQHMEFIKNIMTSLADAHGLIHSAPILPTRMHDTFVYKLKQARVALSIILSRCLCLKGHMLKIEDFFLPVSSWFSQLIPHIFLPTISLLHKFYLFISTSILSIHAMQQTDHLCM